MRKQKTKDQALVMTFGFKSVEEGEENKKKTSK